MFAAQLDFFGRIYLIEEISIYMYIILYLLIYKGLVATEVAPV